MDIRSGQRCVTLTEGDIVLDYGSSFQLITQRYVENDRHRPYLISKRKAHSLIKDGHLLLTKRDQHKTFYRFSTKGR